MLVSPFVILGVSVFFCRFYIFNGKSANDVNPDQMPYFVTSNQGLHCLPMTSFSGFPVRMG